MGIGGDIFLEGLKGKLIGTTCGTCSKKYLPARMFCEDCFDELTAENKKELNGAGGLVSFSEVMYDHRGDKMEKSNFPGLIKL